MKIPPVILWLVPLFLGMGMGWQLRVFQTPEAPGQSSDAKPAFHSASSRNLSEATSSSRRSFEAAGELFALPDSEVYEHMAVFLLNAKAEHFADLYEEFKSRPHRSYQLNRLFFLHWTRVDPESAIEATRGTDDLGYVYRTWACHAPEKALATALENKESSHEVAWGLGEFRPKWLEENWDLVPKDLRLNAIYGSNFWSNADDPESSFRLLIKSKLNFSSLNEKTLLALSREDPLRAYQLASELSNYSLSSQGSQGVDSLISALRQHEPELLSEIASVSKSPIDRNKIKKAQFQDLLAKDPAAAQAMLDGTPRSWLKEDLAISYAKHLLATDPEAGFRHGVNLLRNELGDATRQTDIQYERGSSSRSAGKADTEGLINRLIDQDAASLLDELLPEPDSQESTKFFEIASREWASLDLQGYADWLEGQKGDPEIYSEGVTNIVNELEIYGKFEDSLAWLQSLPGDDERSVSKASAIYGKWLKEDPDGAAAWRLSENFTGDPEAYPLPSTTDQK